MLTGTHHSDFRLTPTGIVPAWSFIYPAFSRRKIELAVQTGDCPQGKQCLRLTHPKPDPELSRVGIQQAIFPRLYQGKTIRFSMKLKGQDLKNPPDCSSASTSHHPSRTTARKMLALNPSPSGSPTPTLTTAWSAPLTGSLTLSKSPFPSTPPTSLSARTLTVPVSSGSTTPGSRSSTTYHLRAVRCQ